MFQKLFLIKNKIYSQNFAKFAKPVNKFSQTEFIPFSETEKKIPYDKTLSTYFSSPFKNKIP